jgi:hypothetical protein
VRHSAGVIASTWHGPGLSRRAVVRPATGGRRLPVAHSPRSIRAAGPRSERLRRTAMRRYPRASGPRSARVPSVSVAPAERCRTRIPRWRTPSPRPTASHHGPGDLGPERGTGQPTDQPSNPNCERGHDSRGSGAVVAHPRGPNPGSADAASSRSRSARWGTASGSQGGHDSDERGPESMPSTSTRKRRSPRPVSMDPARGPPSSVGTIPASSIIPNISHFFLLLLIFPLFSWRLLEVNYPSRFDAEVPCHSRSVP